MKFDTLLSSLVPVFVQYFSAQTTKRELEAKEAAAERENELRIARMQNSQKLLETVLASELRAPEQLNAVHEFINALKE